MTTQNALNTQLVLPSGSTAISQLLYTSAANQVSGLATGNNGILVTSNTGVPSIATTFGQGLAVASSVLSVGAANNIPINTGKGFIDSNGNNLLLFTVTASAVNYWNMANAATAGAPILLVTGTDPNVTGGIFSKGLGQIQFGSNSGANTLAVMVPVASAVNYIMLGSNITGSFPFVQAGGTDTNIALLLAGKGNLGVQIQGTTAGTNVAAGYVGEVISSVIASASAISISSGVAKDLTSISLTAGDWDVYGNVSFLGGATTLQICLAWISLTSATLPDSSLYAGFTTVGSQMSGFHAVAPFFRASISTNTTIYLSGYMTLAASTCTICGGIYARRVR